MNISMLFNLSGILFGLIIGFFSYRIFVNTKGGSSGWKYIAVSGFAFFLWSITQLIFTVFYQWYEPKVFISFFAWTVIGTLSPIGYTQLNIDFGKTVPKYLKPKIFLWVIGALWAILLLINLVILPFNSLLQELAGISLIILVIMLWAGTVYPAYMLWSEAKNWVWLFLLLFAIFLPVGAALGSYTHACCSHSADQFENACSEITVHYADIIYMPCSQGVMNIGMYYNLVEIPFIILLSIAHIGLWHKLR